MHSGDMKQLSAIEPATDAGVFVVTTANGSRYIAVGVDRRWSVRRSPAPGAPTLWLDEGSGINRLEVQVGAPLRCTRFGGYLDADMWSVSGTVETIVTASPRDLDEPELRFALDVGAFSPTRVERGKVLPRDEPPTTHDEVAGALYVDGATFAPRTDQELGRIMNTAEDRLRGVDGAPMTPWQWLAAGRSTGPVLDLLEAER